MKKVLSKIFGPLEEYELEVMFEMEGHVEKELPPATSGSYGPRQSLGRNVARLRRETGLSQMEVGRELKPEDPSYISKIENGIANPSEAFLQKLIGFLECKIEELRPQSPS